MFKSLNDKLLEDKFHSFVFVFNLILKKLDFFFLINGCVTAINYFEWCRSRFPD